MNRYFSLVIIVLVFGCTIGIAAADIPDLVGNWTGPNVGYEDYIGFVENNEGSFFLNITEQKDRIFAGFVVTTDSDREEVVKTIAGVISPDGKELYMAEKTEGIATGYILGENELELIYLEVSDPIYAGIDHLYRVE